MFNFSNLIPEYQDFMKHLNITLKGRVQGVGFRYSAIRAANTYKINGFVRNERNGTVYMEAEAEDINLKLFLEWCRNGPGLARVDEIKQTESGIRGFEDFRILH